MAIPKSSQARYTAAALSFFVILIAITILVIKVFVSPQLQRQESDNVEHQVSAIGTDIVLQLGKIQAQQRSLTQTVAQLPSEAIDAILPALVDQYGTVAVFGGGVWPLPFKRDPSRDRFSSFVARDNGGKLVENTHWNTPESLKYYEQAWYKAGADMAKGQCAWARAYQDDASPQPRTNCAMPIYKGDQLWGVATIDLTLGFFNQLVEDTQKKIHGDIVIFEADGKVVSNTSAVSGNVVLKNVNDLASSSPFFAQIKNALPQLSSGPRQFEYRDGVSRTMFVLPVSGTPWFLATSLPTSLLTVQSDRILSRLGMVQIPLVLILLAAMILMIRVFMQRLAALNASIVALNSGDADLTRRLPGSGNPEFDAVAGNFNTFLERLQTLMKQVLTGTQSIDGASREIARGNEDLSARTEEQAASLEETASAMEELTATVKQNADNAQQANTMAVSASRVAEDGGKVVGEVVETMKSINASSQKMADIIAVIDGIAFQTNILALNAAVEAARAGEQGRGFAVVAGEVRTLAQRSAAAAKEISTLIGDSVSRVSSGTSQAERAGETMQLIVENVKKVRDVVAQISEASAQQSGGIEEVNRAVSQMDDVTQQNAALVEQAAAAAASLEAQSAQLAGLVSAFKT